MVSTIKKHGVILNPTDNSFENEGVFNPAVYQDGNTVHVFYRAVRKGNFSTIGYCRLDGPLELVERSNVPIIFPEKNYEFKGTEDPRIVKIENSYYLSYSAYDGVNVFGTYAVSEDLKHFKKKGIITPQFTFEEYAQLIHANVKKISEKHSLFYDLFLRFKMNEMMKGQVYVWDKNIIFFPRKINGKFAVLHRLFPSIQVFYFENEAELTHEFWCKYVTNLKDYIVLSPKYHFEGSHVGGGCPPIETDQGWLLIYHAAEMTATGLVYQAGACLLALDDPTQEISRLKKPLFCPTEYWEIEGMVNNVVFPTGTALFDDELYIYYGAADSKIAVASININTLLEAIKNA